jgi:HSP20 family molecular chaperone IbpA
MEVNRMSESQELQVQDKQEIEESTERTHEGPVFVPRVDIYERDGEITLVADMPGVDESSVNISVERDVLTIHGSVDGAQPEGYDLAYAEYRVGDYERSFSLSNRVDQDNIQATLKDGVLHLTLPNAGPTTTKIAVQAG